MSFIGKRINKLNKLSLLEETDNFIIDSQNMQESCKVNVSDVRDSVISSDLVDGSTVELQMITTQGKQNIVNALSYHNVEASVQESFESLENKVSGLNTATGKDKKNVPWLHCTENTSTNFIPEFSKNISTFINPYSQLTFKPLENGVLEIGKIQQDENGLTEIKSIKVDTNGPWKTIDWNIISRNCAFTYDGGIAFIADGSGDGSAGTCTFNIITAKYNEDDSSVEYDSASFELDSFSTSQREYVYCTDTLGRFYMSWRWSLLILDVKAKKAITTSVSTSQEYAIIAIDNLINIFSSSGTGNQSSTKLSTYLIKNNVVSLLKETLLTQNNNDSSFINYYIKELNSIVGYNNTNSIAYRYNLDTFEKENLYIENNSNYFSLYNFNENFPYQTSLKTQSIGSYYLTQGDRYVLILDTYIRSIVVFDPTNNKIIVPYITGIGTELGYTADIERQINIQTYVYMRALFSKENNKGTIYVNIPNVGSGGTSSLKIFSVNAEVDTNTINAITKDGKLYLLGDM